METTAVRPKGFLCFTIVANAPGNLKYVCFQRAKEVTSFAEVPPEFAQLGAATRIDTPAGMFYVTESIEEIAERMATAIKEE